MRLVNSILVCAVALLLGACAHVKGVAVMDNSERPMKTAKFSVNRPDGVGAFAYYDVNAKGEFDFWIAGLDTGSLFVYDGSAPPRLTMRRLEHGEINEHMKIHVPSAGALPPDLELPR